MVAIYGITFFRNTFAFDLLAAIRTDVFISMFFCAVDLALIYPFHPDNGTLLFSIFFKSRVKMPFLAD